MRWIAPTEKDTGTRTLEDRLWAAADQLRANSGLTSAQYSQPVLGLIFLRFAEVRFLAQRAMLEKQAAGGRRGARVDDPTAYQAEGILYLTPLAQFDHLLRLPEGADVGKAVNEAMRDIESKNPQLAGVLPKTYQIFDSTLLKNLLRKVSEIPATAEGDTFGRIYEYFLGEFARTEGSRGGEFYTPISIVRLLVEVLEPFHGRILDPACGSGGMFVQSARFVAEHKKSPATELAIHGQEKVADTVKLCRMNLAIHGLEGDIREGISYYDDLHNATGRFDFVLANPPFNVNAVDKERLEGDVGRGRRFPFGLPRSDNANYLWIQLFYSTLSEKGRAGFVMANSASDARSSEQELRRQLVEDHAADVVVAVGPNMFYTVTLPVTLWFLDRGKKKTERADKVLFLDARHIYRQIDRAHRDWTSAQIGFLANVVRLYRGEELDFTCGAGPNVAVHQHVKIALVAPPFIAVPPPGYGGTELFIGSLATALLERGHEVVVYANGESYGRFEVRALYPTSEWPPAAGAAGQFRNLAHCAWAVRDAASTCDVVHINDVAGVFFSSYIPQPVLQTLHHAHDEMLSNLYALHTDVTYVAISDAQRRRERMPRLVTVHHGIDCSQYRMGQDKDEFVAFLGRIAPCKGVDVAINVARMSGVPLKIAGQIQAEFREFWESNVKPQVDGQLIEYVGEADISVKNELLGRARALLFPIQWDEPFGLVMLEAMACGTPVIAFDRGSVGEVVVPGSTGWICQSADEMAAVVGELATISSWACRRHVEEHFSVERMASDYERVYQLALSDREGPHDQFVPVTEAPGASADHANGASRIAPTDTRLA